MHGAYIAVTEVGCNINIMEKSILVLFLTAILLSISSCGKTHSAEPYPIDITGEWHLVSAGELPMESIDVYVSFGDGTFDLYQKVGEGRYFLYDGTYTLTGNVLSGLYSDGTSWGSDYDISLETDSLVLTANNGSGEVSTYVRKAIPDEVSGNVAVKSSMEEAPVPFL